jgi:hypothetical protein
LRFEIRAVIDIVPGVSSEKRVILGNATSVQVCFVSNKDVVSEVKAKVNESQVSVL